MTIHPAINIAYLAKRLGVSRSFLYQVRDGKRPLPDDKKDRLNEVLTEIETFRVVNNCKSEHK